MSQFNYLANSRGEIVAKDIIDPATGKILETIKLTEEEQDSINNPESQFSNLDFSVPSEEPEPSFLQDVQRVGLKTAFGPVQLASDLVVRPFKSGLLVLTDKNSQLPVMTPNGDFVIVSTGDFMDGSIEDMMKADKDMKIILENAANQKKLLLNEQIKVNK